MPGRGSAPGAAAQDTLALAMQRLNTGDLNGAIELAGQAGDDADLRAWLARARALSTVEKALEKLRIKIDAAIDRALGEAS